MPGRMEGKIAIVMGGGQTPGETIGNGKATAVLLAREGASVFVVDRDLARAEETRVTIRGEGSTAEAASADVRNEDEVRAAIEACVAKFGRIDVLHNNVGASLALGDTSTLEMDVPTWDRIFEVNLRGMWLACKHAIPVMQQQGSGSIVNISSMAAKHDYPYIGYKTSKVAVIGLTEYLAAQYARDGIRVNVILPGLMNTPMAIEPRAQLTGNREEVVAQRDARVPLGRKMGTGWDVGFASLFLHSDEAKFISGVTLPVDGASGVASR